jgi:hypothetical protein
MKNVMGRCLQRLDLARDSVRTLLLCDLQIVKLLEVQPKLWCGSKEARQAQSRVGCDGSLAVHNFRNAGHGDMQLDRELVHAQPERVHELLEKNFTGMNGA